MTRRQYNRLDIPKHKNLWIDVAGGIFTLYIHDGARFPVSLTFPLRRIYGIYMDDGYLYIMEGPDKMLAVLDKAVWENADVSHGALEKIEDSGYRPFAGAEEYKPHRGEYIQDIESGAIYLPLGYKESGVLVGAEWVWYSYLFEHCVFADTGEPVGVKL